MAVEIERKFLAASDAWRQGVIGTRAVRQGYINRTGPLSARVRAINGDAYITIKNRVPGATRAEFEYAIPLTDAIAMLALCEAPLIEKLRHTVMHNGREWAVDEFEGAHAGLVLAECELNAPDEVIDIPTWAGVEVTDDPAYRNEAL